MRQEKKYLGNYRKKEIRVFMKGSLQMFTHPILSNPFFRVQLGELQGFPYHEFLHVVYFIKYLLLRGQKLYLTRQCPLTRCYFNPYALVPDVQYCTVLYFWFQYTWAVTPREINRAKTQKLKIYGQVVPAIRLN